MLSSQGLGFLLDEVLAPPNTQVDTGTDIMCVHIYICIHRPIHTLSLLNWLSASVHFYVFSQS